MYDNDVDFKEVTEFLPKPCGYHLLVAIPEVKAKTDGGIYKPDELRELERLATIVGCVVAVGPDSYADSKKFPSGAWCKQGDWVVFRSYSGTRIKVKGQQFRLINDDTVEGVVDDPRMIERAF